MRAPISAIDYYSLDPSSASMRDVILSVRADEAVHRSVNHHFSDIP
jgi:ubiquinol oxidase